MASKRKHGKDSFSNRKRRKIVREEVDGEVASGRGQAWVIGEGFTGQLGSGQIKTSLDRLEIVEKLRSENIIQVAGGGMHTLCLTKKGIIFSFGCNDQGALGRETTFEFEWFVPYLIPNLGRYHVTWVTCGDTHSSALTDSGRIFLWGTFRLSDGTCHLIGPVPSSPTPTELHLRDKAIQVASGNNHLLVLTETRQLLSIGAGDCGQLGRMSAVNVTSNESCHGHDDDDRHQLKSLMFRASPVIFHDEVRIEKVWAGSFNSFSRSTTGGIFAWGLNNRQQLGFKDKVNKYFPQAWLLESSKVDVEEIAGGDHHTLVLDKSGKVFSIGDGTYGQLGRGTNESATKFFRVSKLVPCSSICAGLDVSYAVTRTGALFAWGSAGSHIGSKLEDRFCPKQLRCYGHVRRVSSRGLHTIVLSDNQRRELIR